MLIETSDERAARKRAFLLTHPISGGVDPDPDDPDAPPEEAPEEPGIDPAAGGPKAADGSPTSTGSPDKPPPTPPAPPQPVFSSGQIAELAAGISDGITKGFKPADAPAVAAAPSGPTPAELQTKIDELDTQIDMAAEAGEKDKVRTLSRRRDDIRDQKFDIERIAPLRIQGANSINSLAIDNVRRSDPYFLKYEKEIMALLTPSMQQGQALTVEIVQNALAYVKGRHIDEIVNDEHEARARKAKIETPAPMPGTTTGRARAATQPKTPDTIRERFGVAGHEAFQAKINKGYTEDTYARRLGYQNKADWFAADDAMSRSDFNIGLDSVWDKVNKRWVTPNELNEFYNS